MNNLNAQNTLNRDKIEIIIGSYKYENNAYLHKIKLKKKGFKGVRVLPKKNKFFKVSINQFKTLKETNQFIDSVGIKKIDYWLFYQEDYKASIEIVINEIDSLNVKTKTIPVEEIIQSQVKDSIMIFIKENENKVSSNSKTNKETSVDLESSVDLIETFNDNLYISEHLDSINSIYLKTQSNLKAVHADDETQSTKADGLVMEFLDPVVWKNLGNPPSFESVTRDTYDASTKRSFHEIVTLARCISDAGAALHAKGVHHGDLYAHNVLWRGTEIGNKMEPPQVPFAKLSDFGAAFFYEPRSEIGRDLERPLNFSSFWSTHSKYH